jgi:hypothetical protein
MPREIGKGEGNAPSSVNTNLLQGERTPEASAKNLLVIVKVGKLYKNPLK